MRKNSDIEKLLKEGGSREHFRVPEGYFDRLPGRVTARVHEKEQPQARRGIPAVIRLNKVGAVAAAVVVFAVAGYFTLRSLRAPGEAPAGSAKIVSEMLPGVISEEVLYDFIEEEGVPTGLSLTDEDNSGVIIDYLIDEGVDETLLAQQL